jgi:hypothetical protein
VTTFYAPLTIEEVVEPRYDKLVDGCDRALYMIKYGELAPDERIYNWVKKHTGWVYFIQCGGFIKIGFSGDPLFRLRALQKANPLPLRLVATQRGERDLERKIHRHFRQARREGEWFKFTDAIYWHVVMKARLHVDPQTLSKKNAASNR